MAFIVPFIPAIVAAAGTAVAVYGAVQQGENAKKSANFAAQVADQNAAIDRQQAAAQAEQDKRAGVLRLGAIRASAGASGVGSTGSVLDVLGDVASQSELQRQNTLYGGEIKAAGERNTAASERFGGAAAARAGAISAGSSLLSGAGDTYGKIRGVNAPSTAPRASYAGQG